QRQAIDGGALEVEQAGLAQRRDEGDVGRLPDAGLGPLGEAPPAGAARAPAQLGGQGLPTDALAEDEEDAVEAQAVGDAGPPAVRGGPARGRSRPRRSPPRRWRRPRPVAPATAGPSARPGPRTPPAGRPTAAPPPPAGPGRCRSARTPRPPAGPPAPARTPP